MSYSAKRWLVTCTVLLLMAGTLNAGIRITIKNPSDFARRSETIELNWQKIVSLNPGLTPGTVAVFLGKTQIPRQCIDETGDGVPDLLLFQVDLLPHAAQSLRVESVKHPKDFPSCVDARFELPREDVAWESDRIAFRIYGPALAADVNNGVDVWVKRVRSLIVDKWYSASAAAKKDTYHEDHGEGADFFSVGRTLGAGGCAVAKGDTLYQPGVFTSQAVIATGPVRALFTVTYGKGTIDGVPFNEVKQFAIDAGHNLNRIQVTYTGIGSNDSLRFVAGLVKRKGVVCQYDSASAWMALWGQVNDDPVNEYLGTGIVLPREGLTGMKDLKDQYLLAGRVRDGVAITYYAGAGWTRSGDFKTQDDWVRLLQQWSSRLIEPVVITMKKIR
jgi:pectinesterase